MALTQEELRFILRMRDEATRTLTRHGKSVKSTADLYDRTTRSSQRLGRQVKVLRSTFGRFTALLGTAGLAGTLFASTRLLARFGQEISNVSALTGATGANLRALEQQARNLGATTVLTAKQAAEGQAFLARAGFTTLEIYEALPKILDLAIAGNLDLGRAADIASNVLRGFGLEANESGRFADVLAKAAATANTTVEQLGVAMSFTAPVARAMGVSVEEAAAAVSVLSNAGLQAERAGTGLRNILATLALGSSATRKALKNVGLELSDVDVRTRGLTNVLITLRDSGFDVAAALEAAGKRGGPAMEVLLRNIPELERFNKELNNADGTSKRLAETMRDNLGGDLKALTSAIQDATLEMGEGGFTGVMREVVQGITAWVRANRDLFNSIGANLASAIKTVADNINLVVAAMIAYVARSALVLVANTRLITSFKLLAATSLLGGVRLNALSRVFSGVTGRMVIARGAVRGLGAAFLGLVGGPLGLLALAFGGLVAAVTVFGNKTVDVTKRIGDAEKALQDLREALKEDEKGSTVASRAKVDEARSRGENTLAINEETSALLQQRIARAREIIQQKQQRVAAIKPEDLKKVNDAIRRSNGNFLEAQRILREGLKNSDGQFRTATNNALQNILRLTFEMRQALAQLDALAKQSQGIRDRVQGATVRLGLKDAGLDAADDPVFRRLAKAREEEAAKARRKRGEEDKKAVNALQSFIAAQEKVILNQRIIREQQGKNAVQRATIAARAKFEAGARLVRQEAERRGIDLTILKERVLQSVRDGVAAKASDQIEKKLRGIDNEIAAIGRTREEQIKLSFQTQIDTLILAGRNDEAAKYIAIIDKTIERLKAAQAANRTASAGFRDFWKDFVKRAENSAEQVKEIMGTVVGVMEDAFVGFFTQQKRDWKQWAADSLRQIAAVIARIVFMRLLKAAIGAFDSGGIFGNTGTGAQGLGPQFSGGSLEAQGSFAKGAAFAARNKFATGASLVNQVVSNPTSFGFKRNGVPQIGQLGEAGPEAILPLARDSRGRLGVRTVSGPETSMRGNTLIYRPTFVLEMPAGRSSDDEQNSEALARQFDRAARAAMLQVIEDEQRPGGKLAGTSGGRLEL